MILSSNLLNFLYSTKRRNHFQKTEVVIVVIENVHSDYFNIDFTVFFTFMPTQ